MADVRIPTGFCPIITSYTGSGPGGVSMTEVEGGPHRFALAWDRGPMQFALTMRLTPRAYEVWSHFYLNIIDKGAITFAMPLDSGLGMVDHDVNIIPDSYSVTRVSQNTDVSFTVMAEPGVYAFTDEESQEVIDEWEREQRVPNLKRLLDRLAIFSNQDVMVLND